MIDMGRLQGVAGRWTRVIVQAYGGQGNLGGFPDIMQMRSYQNKLQRSISFHRIEVKV